MCPWSSICLHLSRWIPSFWILRSLGSTPEAHRVIFPCQLFDVGPKWMHFMVHQWHEDVKRQRLTSCHALPGSLKTRLYSVSHQAHSNFSNAKRFGMRWWDDARPLAYPHEPTLFHSDLELERQGWTFRCRLAGATVPSKMVLVRKRHLFDVIWTFPKDLAMLQECLCHLQEKVVRQHVWMGQVFSEVSHIVCFLWLCRVTEAPRMVPWPVINLISF